MQQDLDLWTYLERREEEIVRKRQQLEIELVALRQARVALENDQRDKRREDANERMTIKEMVRSVLKQYPAGGTSDQIISWINQLHEVEVARTSLSPQLSRLKAEGTVTWDEDTGIWHLDDPTGVHPRHQKSAKELYARRSGAMPFQKFKHEKEKGTRNDD